MELDATALQTIAGTLGTTALGAAGAIKWIFNRIDKQFADAEAKAEKARLELKAEADKARAEIRADLDECDAKHQKCEEDRIKIIEEVSGLRAEVKAVKSQVAGGGQR